MRAPALLAPGLRHLLYRCLLVAAILAYPAHFVLRAQSRSKALPATPRIDLHPKLVAGEVLRYQVQLQTVTDTTRSGAVSDPQGPSRLTVTWDATVRLEVLGQAADRVVRDGVVTANSPESSLHAQKTHRSVEERDFRHIRTLLYNATYAVNWRTCRGLRAVSADATIGSPIP